MNPRSRHASAGLLDGRLSRPHSQGRSPRILQKIGKNLRQLVAYQYLLIFL
jgi:hypothetical protein